MECPFLSTEELSLLYWPLRMNHVQQTTRSMRDTVTDSRGTPYTECMHECVAIHTGIVPAAYCSAWNPVQLQNTLQFGMRVGYDTWNIYSF
jgi:hypothetical protein